MGFWPDSNHHECIMDKLSSAVPIPLQAVSHNPYASTWETLWPKTPNTKSLTWANSFKVTSISSECLNLLPTDAVLKPSFHSVFFQPFEMGVLGCDTKSHQVGAGELHEDQCCLSNWPSLARYSYQTPNVLPLFGNLLLSSFLNTALHNQYQRGTHFPVCRTVTNWHRL